MATYTPLSEGQQPAFGTSGPAVSALQAQLNAQYANTPGYTPLKVDGLYGPLTQAATNFKPGVANPGIFSTTNYRDGLDAIEGQVNEFQNDPYQQLFQRLEERNRMAEEAAIASATAEAKRQDIAQEEQYRRESMAQGSAGIMSGLSRYAPEMQAGIMNQLYQENLNKVRNIQLEEEIAIAKARQARMDNDLEVAREQLDYAKQLRKEKADALLEAQKLEFEKEKFAKNLALDWATENRPGGVDNTITDTDTIVGGADQQINILDSIKENYSTKELFNLAKKLNVERVKNLSRQNEIDELIATKLPEYIQQLSLAGYNEDEIAIIIEELMK